MIKNVRINGKTIVIGLLLDIYLLRQQQKIQDTINATPTITIEAIIAYPAFENFVHSQSSQS